MAPRSVSAADRAEFANRIGKAVLATAVVIILYPYLMLAFMIPVYFPDPIRTIALYLMGFPAWSAVYAFAATSILLALMRIFPSHGSRLWCAPIGYCLNRPGFVGGSNS